MARKRQLDPGIWTSEQFMRLKSPNARLLFIGMITQADDEGRLRGGPLYLKSTIFPSDHVSLTMVKEWRDKIVGLGLCCLYTVEGNEYLWLPQFQKHQYMTKRFRSTLPSPPIQVNNHGITDTQQGNDLLHGRSWKKLEEVDKDTGSGRKAEITAAAAYESHIGMLTPIVAVKMDQAITEYSEQWVIAAIEEAATHNKRNWSYTEAILRRWGSDGRGPPANPRKESNDSWDMR
jgi:DnaD/phage-associated family protein